MFAYRSTQSETPLPPITHQGYQYGSSGFTVTAISRVSLSELRALFLPKNKQELKSAEQYRYTKKWLTAQLKLYGVQFSRKHTIDELKGILKAAIANGKCESIPEQVLNIERDLAKRYEEENTKHIEKIRNTKEIEFAKVCNDPVAAANYDVELFIKHYFMDSTGKAPDRKKTPKPLRLPDVSRGLIHASAGRVPGLHTRSGGEEPDRILVIGWNRDKVWNEAGKIDAEQAAEKRQEEEEKHKETLAEHRELQKKIKKKGKKAYDPKGVYSVKFPELAEQYGEGVDGLWMTIMWDKESKKDPVTGERTRLMADFDFNILEGIMRFRKEGEEPMLKDDSEEEDEEDDDASEDEERDSESPPPPRTNSKRKRKESSGNTRRKSQVAKKAKGSSKASLKLLLNWCGRETGEGEIQVDHGDNTGYIQFTDDTCTAFKGKITTTYLGDNSEFSGIKVGEVGDNEYSNSRWSDYSEKAYEYARVNRWR